MRAMEDPVFANLLLALQIIVPNTLLSHPRKYTWRQEGPEVVQTFKATRLPEAMHNYLKAIIIIIITIYSLL